jgi:hypothetical protein
LREIALKWGSNGVEMGLNCVKLREIAFEWGLVHGVEEVIDATDLVPVELTALHA